MAIATIGLDLTQPNFPLVGFDGQFKEVKRQTLRRNQVLGFFDRLSPCRVGMELCVGSHYWGRQFSALGHEVILIPEQYVIAELHDKNKGFFNNARILASTLTQTNIPSISVKTVAQQELHAIHRMHSQCVKDRSALCNLTWNLLGECGIPLPKGVNALRRHIPGLLDDSENGLSDRFRRMLSHRYHQLLELDEHLNFYTEELEFLGVKDGAQRDL